MTPAIRRILCATDLSPASAAAWEEALALGRVLGSRILLLHVVTPPVLPVEGYLPPAVYDDLVAGATRDALDRLDGLARGAAGPALEVVTRVEVGSPAPRVLEVASREAADLLVVGTHGRTGLSGLLLGSVADRLVRQAACPVLTVRPRPGDAPASAITRLCYATDFSPAAQAAWPWVVALADATGAEVDLVHVTFEPIAGRHEAPEALGPMAQALRGHAQAAAERFLEWSPSPRRGTRIHLAHGDPGEQIVWLAQELRAHLVVMGTHGSSGLVRWMLGSVAHRVIQLSRCPVLTVGPASRTGPPAGAAGEAHRSPP
jgi:nucleotide-binding universal stress UspA family protein